jgi:hypothetical protein
MTPHSTCRQERVFVIDTTCIVWEYIIHLRRECHNSKFGIYELLVWKETLADALLTGIVSWRSSQNSLLESSCVVVALIGNYSTTKPFKCFSWKITNFELWHCHKWVIYWWGYYKWCIIMFFFMLNDKRLCNVKWDTKIAINS